MSHEKIGNGLFFDVYSRRLSSKVFKVARFGRAANNWFGEAFRLRMEHDIKLVEQKFENRAIKARVRKVTPNSWVIIQSRLDKIIPLDSTNVTPDLMNQAFQMIKIAKETDQETGFLFDFLGSESWKNILKYIFTSYWALPGLLIENNEIKIVDNNLIWSGKKTDYLKEKIKSGEITKASIIPIIEPLTYYIGGLSVKMCV